MPNITDVVIYQLKVVLLGISPMIWRRLLVCSDSTMADLHHILQIALGWTYTHLHQFRIHWPMFRRLCAVADYLQPEFPDALLPAFIRRSPCNAVDELHILQCASP
jgi:hypothetical protein